MNPAVKYQTISKIKGYVCLKNEMIEALAKEEISGEMFRIYFALLRLSWGKGKDRGRATKKQILEMTNLKDLKAEDVNYFDGVYISE